MRRKGAFSAGTGGFAGPRRFADWRGVGRLHDEDAPTPRLHGSANSSAARSNGGTCTSNSRASAALSFA